MRFDGTLEKWNDDRGFGFIAPRHGGEAVFVHVSAFQRDGRRPKIGEPLTFEVEAGGDGRKRAINVQRPGQRTGAAEPRRAPPAATRRGGRFTAQRVVLVLFLAALGGYGYTHFASVGSFAGGAPTAADGPARTLAAAPRAAQFRCDGRTTCSQMTSCEEAKFFLRNCPGTTMDGDGDGIPCERQWCVGPGR